MEEKTATGETQQTRPAHEPGCFFCTTAKPLMEQIWTEATRDHFRNSRIEFLKGLRSLIDNRISRLSREHEPKGAHVTVE